MAEAMGARLVQTTATWWLAGKKVGMMGGARAGVLSEGRRAERLQQTRTVKGVA